MEDIRVLMNANILKKSSWTVNKADHEVFFYVVILLCGLEHSWRLLGFIHSLKGGIQAVLLEAKHIFMVFCGFGVAVSAVHMFNGVY